MKLNLKIPTTLIILSTPAWLPLSGCEKYNTCENTLSCDDYADGDGDGDAGGTGGSGGGDGDGDGDSDGDGGIGGEGGDLNDPCLECSEGQQCTDGGECVECLGDEHCDEPTPVCETASGACVGCLDAGACGDPTMPLCNSDTNECESCDGDESCGELGNRCLDTGECVECTPETDDRTADDDDCGTGVCNPETHECETTLTQMGKEVCEPCIADSECEADHNCVPMEFGGELRTGGWCLRTLASGACAQNPYRSPTPDRLTLSGETAQVYCGINEMLTTCEAVLDLEGDKECAGPEDCGAPGLDDGLCEEVSTVLGRCTYECSGDSAECRPSGRGSICAGEAAGEAGSYCGGMD